MNWKKNVNLFLSMILAFSTMMSDVTVYAEGEEETEEPVIEEVTEVEETAEPEIAEITTEVQEAEESESDQSNEGLSESEEAALYAASDYEYTEDDEGVTITKYSGSETDVIIPSEINGKPVVHIGARAFSYLDNITSIIIPDTVTSIESWAFNNCDCLTEISIPGSVKTIEKTTVSYCYGLKKVTIKEGVESIKNAAFHVCGIESATIPSTVSELEGRPFTVCGKLAAIMVDPSNPVYDSRDNCNAIIETATNSILLGCKNTVIPNTVTSIGDYAFDQCENLTNITIPESVTKIGDCAFEQCSSLKSIDLPETITSLGYSAFSSCSSLTEITVPGGITEIGSNTFYNCKALETATISEGVQSIGNQAFYRCNSLAVVNLPGSITSIDYAAFADCTSLKNVYYSGTALQWEKVSIGGGNDEFLNADFHYSEIVPLESIIIDSNNGVVDLPMGQQKHLKITKYPSNTTDTLFWESADESIVTVDQSGKITAIQKGSANITVKNETGTVSATVLVTVGDALSYSYTAIDGGIVITGYNGNDTDIIIPREIDELPVIKISDRAFDNCSNIISVVISEGVVSLGDEAFRDCTSLSSIVIPKSLTSIGMHAFVNCSSLVSIDIPGNVTEIKHGYEDYHGVCGCFSGCTSLTTVSLPPTLEKIGSYAFYGCTSLKSINIPTALTTIEEYAFYNCDQLTDIVFPEGMSVIGESAFSNASSLMSVSIPSTITSIGDSAFSDCEKLATVSMPKELKTSTAMIGDHAFSSCKELTEIDIPEGVSVIGQGAFRECDNLLSASVPSTIIEIGKYAFYDCEQITTINMPEKLQVTGASIGDFAFYNCNQLSSIIIPEGVTSLGILSFYKCSSLSEVIIHEGITELHDASNGTYDDFPSLGLFGNCVSLTTVSLPSTLEKIGSYSFYGCANLKTVNIPDSVTSIGYNAFYGCSSIESLVIPEGVTELPSGYNRYGTFNGVFSGCSSLKTISLPSTLTKIGSYAFHDCISLTSVTMPDRMTATGVIIEDEAFCNCSSLLSIKIPEGVTEIADGGRYNSTTKEYYGVFTGCISLTSVTLPTTINKIGYYAFRGCSNLAVVNMPEKLTTSNASIGGSAFSDCSSLSSISIPEGVTSLGFSLCSNCSALETVSLPSTIIEIGGAAFKDCSSLLTVHMPDKLINANMSIGGDAFRNCVKLLSVFIPEGSISIGDDAFRDCSSLSTVSISSTITNIGEWAFADCESLVTVNIPDKLLATNVPIGNGAFLRCSNLESIIIPEGINKVGNYAFQDCSSLLSASIPSSINTIGLYAFKNCTSLETVSAPEKLQASGASIGYEAFINCTDLISITIPEGITNIGGAAFYNCSSLKSLIVPEGVSKLPGEFQIYIPEPSQNKMVGICEGCSSLESVTLPSTLQKIGDAAFRDCSNLSTVTMPDSMTTTEVVIGKEVFLNCSSLLSIDIPAGVTTVGESAFKNCSAMKTAVLPSSVSAIGPEAFSGCSSLVSINIPEGVETIEYNTFDNCTSLISAPLPSTLISIEGSAFNNCSNLSDVSLPESVTEIGRYAFYNCEKYSDYIIGTDINEIGEYAFSGSGIEKVFLYGNTNVENYAFEKCNKLNTVVITTDYQNLASVFSGCKNIKYIYYSSTEDEFITNGGNKQVLYEIVHTSEKCPDSESVIETDAYGYYLGSHENKKYTITANVGWDSCSYVEREKTDPLADMWDVNSHFNVNVDSVEIGKGKMAFHSDSFTFYHVSTRKNISVTQIGDARGKKINFTSSDDNVVAIDESVSVPAGAYWNTIVATGAGTATITATTEDGKYSASMEVTVLDTEEHFGFLSEIRYKEKILVIDGEEHTFRNDDPNHLWPFQSFDNDHFDAYILYYVMDGIIVDVDFLRRAVEVEPINPAANSSLSIDDIFTQLTFELKLSDNLHVIGLDPTNDNFVVATESYSVDLLSDENIQEINNYDYIDTTKTLIFTIIASKEVLQPGNKVFVSIREDFIKYDIPQEFLDHNINEDVKTVPIDWSFTINNTFRKEKDNWNFTNNYVEEDSNGGFDKKTTYKLSKIHYEDFVNHISKGEKSDLEKEMNDQWCGSCEGLSVIMALIFNGNMPLSAVPGGRNAVDLYHLDIKPKDNSELNSYINYYYLSQFFPNTCTRYNACFNDWKNKANSTTEEMFKGLLEQLSKGKVVPFGYTRVKSRGFNKENFAHTILAVSYEKIKTKYHADEYCKWVEDSKPDILYGGYLIKFYNVNQLNTFQYLWVSEDYKQFYGEIGVTIYNKDSDLLELEWIDTDESLIYPNNVYRGLDTVQKILKFSSGSSFCVLDSKENNTLLEYVDGTISGAMQTLNIRSIKNSYETENSYFKDIMLTFENDCEWTVLPRGDNPIIFDVYDKDRFISIDIRNADSVNLSLTNGKVDIHGTDIEFNVEMTTNSEVSEGHLGHSGISGKGSGTINIHAEDYTVVADSDELMTDVKTITYIDTTVAEEEHENATVIDVSGKGSIVPSEKSMVLQNNMTKQIGFKLLPVGLNVTDLIYESSDSEIAAVDAEGKVTALKEGQCTISIRDADNIYSASMSVNVIGDGIYVKSIDPQAYSGSSIKPVISVYDGLNLLTPGTDYTITYKNNVKAYTLKEGEEGFSAKKAPQIIIKAKGNYSGTKTVYFTIDPADITSSDIETLTTAYTGKVQKLSPTVVFEGKTLKKGTDYTLDYPSEGYTEPGTYTITVTGKGNYTGTRTYQMIIGSKDQINLSKATVSFDKKSYVYDKGNQIMPVITVKNGKTVIDPSNYTVTYGENNTVGNGTVTITGNDSETIGTKTVTFKITGTPITKLIKVTVPKSVTRGTELKDAVKIEASLTEGTDYEVTYDETENAGKANIIITGINGYTGTIKKTVTVAKDKLTSSNTTVAVPEAVMMKNGAKPAPTVTVSGTELVEGSDYTLSYANNKKAGTGTVTVKGIGNYTGSLKQTFTISTKDLSETTLEYANNVNSSTKKGSYKTTVVIRDEDGGVLKANTDYTLKFYDGDTEIPATATANDYLGRTLTVKASGKGNYTGEEVLSTEYTVTDSTLNLAKASISIKPQQYQSGKPVEITSTEQFSKSAMGKTPLTLGEDFEVCSYSNNTAKGTATVVFKGIGDYSGYKSVTYKIGQRSIKDYWNGVVSFFSRLMN